MKKKISALFALFIIPVFSVFSSDLISIDPNVLKMGHAKDVQLRMEGLKKDVQLSITPGGAYVRSELNVVADRILSSDPDKLWLYSERNAVTYIVAREALHGNTTERLRQTNTFQFVAKNLRKAISKNNNKVMLQLLDDDLQASFLGEFELDSDVVDVSLSDNYACLLLDDNRVLRLGLKNSRAGSMDKILSLPEASKVSTINIIDDKCVTTDKNRQVVMWGVTNGKLKPLSRYHATGFIQEALVVDENIFLANGNSGITILSILENKLQWLGSYNKLGFITQVSVHHEQLLTADDRGVISLFDISQPENPLLISNFHLHESLKDLLLDGDIAYALLNKTLTEIDFSAKNTPIISTQGVNQGGSRRSFIKDNILYVADWFSGLHLYDISLPRSPRLLSSFKTPGSPKGVVVRDGIAFVADDDHGLQIIDVTNPHNPVFVSELPLTGLAYTMKLVGDLLYIASHRGGFHIVDVSDSVHPTLVSTYDTPSKAWALEVKENLLYVADDSSGLMVFDVENPAIPRLINQFNPGGFAEDVVLKGDKAYIAFFDLGLMVLDIQDPMNLQLISHLQTPGNARGIEIHDDLLYLASWEAGVLVVNIANDKSPNILGHYDTKGATWGLSVKNQTLYAMDWWGGVKVLDVSESKQPTLLGQYQTAGKINDILYRNDFIYTAHGSRGLQVYDANNSLNPVWATGLDFDGDARSIALNGSFALVAAGDGGLVIADVSNPFQIKLLGQLLLPSSADFVATAGKMAFVGTKGGDLYRIDISRPRQPQILNRARLETQAIAIFGQALFQLDSQRKLNIYRVNNMTKKWWRESVNLAVEPKALTATPQGIFIASYSGEIINYQLSKNSLHLATKGHLPDAVLAIHAALNTLYVTTKDNHLYVYHIHDDGAVQLQYVYPTTHEIARITTSKDAIFFSGEGQISSGKLLPEILITQKDAVYIARIPKNMPLGSYNVNIDYGNGEQILVPNAFKVAFPKYKSKFTLEDLKRKMAEKNLPGKILPQP